MIVSGFECVSLSVPSPIGRRCGVQIVNSAWVRFRNTGVKAAVHTGGKSNAAMVLENSFWQWFEEGSSFAFRCDGKSDCRGLPSVILRGNNETFAFVRTVYACVRGPGGSTCIYIAIPDPIALRMLTPPGPSAASNSTGSLSLVVGSSTSRMGECCLLSSK